MSWLNRFSTEEDSKVVQKDEQRSDADRMHPGLTGEFDWNLREKAGMHDPPPPPEYMGTEGEYDPCGLVKRVAIALDEDPEIDDVETLSLIQAGSTIRIVGTAPNQMLIDRIVDLTAHIDGTKSVDTSYVTIQSME